MLTTCMLTFAVYLDLLLVHIRSRSAALVHIPGSADVYKATD